MKRTIRQLALATLLGLCPTAASHADDTTVTILPPTFPFWEAPATTVGESWAKGAASMERAWADVLLKGSQAGINNEEARKRYLENRSLNTRIFWEKRALRDLARSDEQQRLETRLDHDRRRQQQRGRLANAAPHEMPGQNRPNPPVRPDTRQLSLAGEIRWPKALRGDDYIDGRAELERLFAERTTRRETGDGSENCRAVQVATKVMLDKLRRHLADLSPQDYVDARRFVRSLGNEATFSHRDQQLASNSD